MVENSGKALSLDEFLTLPEADPPYEYIDAEVIQKPATSTRFNALKGAVDMNISLPFNRVKGGFSSARIRCNLEGMSIVPDISIFSERRVCPDNSLTFFDDLKTGTLDNYPDWTIDFLSADDSFAMHNAKISGCLRAGTEACWLIDPVERRLLVYSSKTSPQLFNDPQIQLLIPDFIEGLSLTLGTVLNWINL